MSTQPVAYTYQAAVWCVDHTRELAKRESFKAGAGMAWGDTGSAEQILDEWASVIGLDRYDERSFDSGSFPKVVFENQLEGDETCDVDHVRITDTL